MMKSFSKTIRNRLPAIGLGLVSAFGIVAVTSVAAAPAYAQAKASKEFAEPFTQAREMITAKNYSGALPLLDKAAPHAADQAQKLAVEQLRTAVYAGTGNNAKIIDSLEKQLAIGGVPASMVKSHKETIMGLYDRIGQKSKALTLTKEYVAQYGGSSQQFAYIASSELAAKNYSGAVNYGRKAIDQSRAEGKKPREQLFNILMKAHYETEALDKYYDVMEEAVLEYPKDAYWKQLIVARTEKAPGFDRQAMTLDIYRAMTAANVTMSTNEVMAMAEQAMTRSMSAEGEALLKPLVATGTVGGPEDKNASRNKRIFDTLVEGAAADRNGGLAESEADAAAASSGAIYASLGETYIGASDYAKAQELIQKGISKGGMEPTELGMAKLHLGIAQFKAGDATGARKTWGDISKDTAAGVLGRNWSLISRL